MCAGFGWERVHFLHSSWHRAVVWICAENSVDRIRIRGDFVIAEQCTHFYFSNSLPHPTEGEWMRGCVRLSCWLELNHDVFKVYLLLYFQEIYLFIYLLWCYGFCRTLWPVLAWPQLQQYLNALCIPYSASNKVHFPSLFAISKSLLSLQASSAEGSSRASSFLPIFSVDPAEPWAWAREQSCTMEILVEIPRAVWRHSSTWW